MVQPKFNHEGSRLTTIGRYRWNRLPLGMNFSAKIFQRKLNQILDGLDGVACVADDIVVFGRDEEDHEKKFRLLLQRCRETGMKPNRNKCEFRLDKLNFMGHCMSTDGLKPNDMKIEAILKMESPTDVKGIQRLQ